MDVRVGGFAISPSSRRPNLAERGALAVRRSDCGVKRNGEMKLITKPP